jgi:hypothetical protein
MKWDEMTAEERLLAEQLVLNFRELNRACDQAKDGTVLGVCETLALRQGRELMRQTIEVSLHLQKAEVEKQVSPARVCGCGLKKRNRGCRARKVTTAAGEVRLSRVYFECPQCLGGGCPLDERLGVEGRYSREAQRLICLAATSWSYDISSDRLKEFCGLSVSDTTIREVAQEHGAKANAWLRTEPVAVQEFREAQGDVEFTADGTCVNTREGWREMKVAIFSKRKRGASATPDAWATRDLPKPHTRIAFAAIEESAAFGSRWKAWCKRLGLPDTSAITMLADGAKWLWEELRKHLTHADGVLDIFHVLEHITATGQALYKTPEEATAWITRAREALLQEGWTGIDALTRPVTALDEVPRSSADQAALDKLRNYLSPHADHLHYAERLKEGRSIGSGQIEGACKNLIGRRLKANAARWRVARVNRMAGLCSLAYSDQWAPYWQTA